MRWNSSVIEVKSTSNNQFRILRYALALNKQELLKVSVQDSEVEMLLINAMGDVELASGNQKVALNKFMLALKYLKNSQNNSENINVLNHQYGLALYKLKQYQKGLDILLTGFDRVVKIESYFMLPEYAILIMKCYRELGNQIQANKYKKRYEVFSNND